MEYLPTTGELYVLSTVVMCVGSRFFASSAAPRSGYIPIVLYLAAMFLFAAVELTRWRVKRFLIQCAFAILPAAAMVLWMVYK